MKLTLAISGLTASLTVCLLVSSPQLKLTQKIFLGIVGILGAERCIVAIYKFPRKEISKVEQKLAEAEKSRLECENRKLVILQQSRKLAVQLSEAETDSTLTTSWEFSPQDEYKQQLNLRTQENIQLQQHLDTLSQENQRLYERVEQLTQKLEREHQLLQEQQYQIEFNQSHPINSANEIQLREKILILEAENIDLTHQVNTLIQAQQQHQQQIANLEQIHFPLDASWESVVARQIQTYYKEKEIQLNYIDAYQDNQNLILKFQIRPPATIHQALNLLKEVRSSLSLECLEIEFKSNYLQFKLPPNYRRQEPQDQLSYSSLYFQAYSAIASNNQEESLSKIQKSSENIQSLKSASLTSKAELKLKNITTSTQKKCCPHCRSQALRKNGKSPSGIQRYRCKDCQKTFSLESDHSSLDSQDLELN